MPFTALQLSEIFNLKDRTRSVTGPVMPFTALQLSKYG